MSEPQQIWYLAREGSIVLQGSREELARAARGGFLRGDEACWTEGMAGWESVGESQRATWLREASKVHEEMTGTLLQFKAPEGTDELEIPKEPAWARGASEKAKQPSPDRRRSNQGRRSTDKPQRMGLSLVIGVLSGAAIAVLVIFLTSEPPPAPPAMPLSPPASSSAEPAPSINEQTPSSAVLDAGVKAKDDKASKPVDRPIPKAKKKNKPVESQRPAKSKNAKPSEKEPVIHRNKVSSTPDKETLKTAKSALDRVQTEVDSPVQSANREEELKRSLATRQAKFVSCLNSAKIAKPGLRGEVTFVISVSSTGQLTGVHSASGRPGAEYAAACLLGELQALRFPEGEASQVRIKAVVP